MLFCNVVFSILTIVGKHVEGNRKNFYIYIKRIERRPKSVQKISLGDVCIMAFYERL